MTSRATAWLPVGLLLLVAALAVWLNSAVQGVPPKSDGSKRHDPDSMVENFVAKQFAPDGRIRYTLAAQKMVHYPDDDTSHLTAPRFEAFEQDTPPLTVSAQTGMLTQKGDEVFLYGDVLMVREATATTPRMTLRTSYMHVIPDSGIAQTDKPVVMEDPTTIVNAAGMLANNKLRTIALTKVKATYVQKKKS
jgi:lipopolysaccharide export system protein LptC